ncbi:unnamed protein product [Prunus armeniaca]|uniref:Uncharacterized protein n=1 Tax=Prunus armeniaca TaxID=36596 RepID=A0A6J5X7Q8_PRUAR|nr:unnamed protein product [Prunus armeniaca]
MVELGMGSYCSREKIEIGWAAERGGGSGKGGGLGFGGGGGFGWWSWWESCLGKMVVLVGESFGQNGGHGGTVGLGTRLPRKKRKKKGQVFD